MKKEEKLRTKLKKNFDDLINEFKSRGYKVSVSAENFATIRDDKIVAGFCTYPSDFSTYLDNCIAVDRDDCFDKWSHCAIKLPIPRNNKQRNYLFQKIDWLMTKEGLEFSDSYECISEY